MLLEDFADAAPARSGQLDAHAAAIAHHGDATHQAAFLQLVDQQDDVGPAGEELGPQLARFQRS